MSASNRQIYEEEDAVSYTLLRHNAAFGSVVNTTRVVRTGREHDRGVFGAFSLRM